MQPFDYRIAVQDPLQMALAGYQQGQNFQQQRVQAERETQLYDMEMQQYQANQAKLQEEQARAKQFHANLADMFERVDTGTWSEGDTGRFLAENPEVGEPVVAYLQGISEEQKMTGVKDQTRLLMMLNAEAGPPSEDSQVAMLLKERKAAAEAAGMPDQATAAEATLMEYLNTPAALKASLMTNVAITAPEAWKVIEPLVVRKPVERKLVTTDEGVFVADLTADDVAAGMQRLGAAPETSPLVSNVFGRELSPGFKKRDELFADIALEWDIGGGVDALKQLTQIEDVIGRIDRGENISGGVAGFAPDVVRAFVDPNAQDAKDTVEEVVQRNLKAVLGTQFAQNEGAELIKRAFNTKLSPEINRKRLQRLFTQMRLAGEQRKAMVEHFNTMGTLQGYTGRQPSATDFYAAIEGQAPTDQTADQATLDEILNQLPE
jgi:hypothetical protein